MNGLFFNYRDDKIFLNLIFSVELDCNFFLWVIGWKGIYVGSICKFVAFFSLILSSRLKKCEQAKNFKKIFHFNKKELDLLFPQKIPQ